MYKFICMHKDMYVYMYTCIYICDAPFIVAVRKRCFDVVRLLIETGIIMYIYIYIYTRIYIKIYIYIYICTYIYMYILL
jgi:hypothetical protein